ncbi:MAG: class I SAM-dependent methyltransferase [Chloroflexi bacterium]|nr:class I SAM-dependent methyltransferase [Chloroflexota bacterium]
MPSPKRGDIYEDPNFLLRWSHWRRLVLALRLGRDQGAALDLGTGRGFLLPYLVTRYHLVFATEIDQRQDGEEFQDWARGKSFLWWAGERVAKELGDEAHSRLLLLYADGAHLPMASGSVDMVFCLDVLEHMPLELRALTISECHRVLRLGGSLIVSMPRETGFSAWLRFLVRGLFMKNGSSNEAHAGYDSLQDLKAIRRVFGQVRPSYSPVPLLWRLNPTLLVKATKK